MDAHGNIRIDCAGSETSGNALLDPVRVGINGFGRIGRAFTRLVSRQTEKGCITVAHINDPCMNAEQMSYLLRFDSTYGRFKEMVQTVEVNGSEDPASAKSYIKIGSTSGVRVTQEKNFKDIPWNESDVEYVIECSGQCLTVEKANEHLRRSGVEKVILSAPPKDDNIPMFVLGVNHTEYKAGTKIISNSSCTTNCVAPIAQILQRNFGIEEALMTTVHAVTASQKVVDCGGGKNSRNGRCALDNIIPTTTGAASACSRIIPELQGKITGIALRVPVSHVSVVDLTVRTTEPTTLDGIFAAVKKETAEQAPFEELVAICAEETVSTDHTKSFFSAIIDAPSCIQLNPHFFKILAYYDNEMGYAARMVDIVHWVHQQEVKHTALTMKGVSPAVVSTESSASKTKAKAKAKEQG